MKVAVLTGTTFVARGLRYIPQSVSLLKYLSMPVMMGPTPKPILSAHQLTLRRSSKSVIVAPCSTEPRGRNWLRDRCQSWRSKALLQRTLGKDVTFFTFTALSLV